MDAFLGIFRSAGALLLDSAPYVLFGLLVSGWLRVFLRPETVGRHLGRGRFASVFKAALVGIPLPLCSCGVLPAAAGLKRQGANNGAVSAFLISTPESGVDSITISWALLDPLMTVFRPLAAFGTAVLAGVSENLFSYRPESEEPRPDKSCPVDGCCDGEDCDPARHARHHTLAEKMKTGLRFALTDVWGDIAGWFLVGLLAAGFITALIPQDVLASRMGGGLTGMLLMLVVGIPLYICATASTPIAAALILQGVSPGTALVFLLAGPATNVTSLTVLLGLLGRRGTAIYLAAISLGALMAGLALDQVYRMTGLSAMATVGQASEWLPAWLEWLSTAVLAVFSIRPVGRGLARRWRGLRDRLSAKGAHGHGPSFKPLPMTFAAGGSPAPFSAQTGCSDGCGCGASAGSPPKGTGFTPVHQHGIKPK